MWLGVVIIMLLRLTQGKEKRLYLVHHLTLKVPFVIYNEKIKQVFSYKYFGFMIGNLLTWKDNSEFVCKKTKQNFFWGE